MGEGQEPQYRDTFFTRFVRGIMDAASGALPQVQRDVLFATAVVAFLVILFAGSQTFYVMVFGLGAGALAAANPRPKTAFLDDSLDDPRKRLTRLARLADHATSWFLLAGLAALVGGGLGAVLRRGLIAWGEASGWIEGART